MSELEWAEFTRARIEILEAKLEAARAELETKLKAAKVEIAGLRTENEALKKKIDQVDQFLFPYWW